MIVLVGIPSEPPMRLVRRRLDEAGADVTVVDQRRWEDSDLTATVVAGRVTGRLATADREIALEGVRAIFTRMMDDTRLPGIEDEPVGSERRRACRRFHAALSEWIELSPGRVLTRARAQASNGSKAYQALRIRACGFSIPSTLITNTPDEVLAFRAEHRRIVFKSASGERSIVKELVDEDLERLDDIGWCPVQFQELVTGRDVRVHVVGGDVFATAIASSGLDYRYAESDGGTTELSETRLPRDVARACVRLAESLELPLAGIDLRLADDGRVVCFEVNPSPGFSYYESHTGQPIAASIARLLAAP